MIPTANALWLSAAVMAGLFAITTRMYGDKSAPPAVTGVFCAAATVFFYVGVTT